MVEAELLRLAAFTTQPSGGNPAGVWIGTGFPADDEMQRIAAEVGYSETAFLVPTPGGAPGHFRVRYFSPLAEVPFCGHATIASGVALAERDGPGALVFHTMAGAVPVDTQATDGALTATLTSVVPHVEDLPHGLLEQA